MRISRGRADLLARHDGHALWSSCRAPTWWPSCATKRFDKAVRGSLRRVRMLGGDALFTAETQEPNWQKAHNILLPTFAHRMMQTYHGHARHRRAARDQVGAAERRRGDRRGARHDRAHPRHDRPVRLQLPLRSFYRSDNHPYVGRWSGRFEAVMKMRGLPLEDITQRKSRKSLEGGCRLHERHRRPHHPPSAARCRPTSVKPDLLGHMLSGIDKQSGERLDDINIRYQMNTFLIAGHETTSGMLSFAIYFLLNNPHVMQKAYEEVDRVLGRDINVRPTAQQVNQLVYIGQILKEVAAAVADRAGLRSLPLSERDDRREIQAAPNAFFVTVLTAMLHRDKSVWGRRPGCSIPTISRPEREAKMPPHVFKPFGSGQRACIGRQFAMTEASLVLGLVLQRFRLIDHALSAQDRNR